MYIQKALRLRKRAKSEANTQSAYPLLIPIGRCSQCAYRLLATSSWHRWRASRSRAARIVRGSIPENHPTPVTAIGCRLENGRFAGNDVWEVAAAKKMDIIEPGIQ